jgi:serine/threonine protein kinase
MDFDGLIAVLILAAAGVLAVIIGVALIIVIRGRKAQCPTCGARLPRRASRCPECGTQLGQKGAPEPARRSTSLPAGSFELAGTQGPLQGQHFSIPAQGLTLGRHPDNDVILSEELMVSRHHAVVAYENGQHVLYDRDSANGTWVNEQRVFRHVLTPGDRIQFWRAELVFGQVGAPPPSPLPTVSPLPVVRVEGEQFGDYVLESLIGRGGMSEVYRARDRNGRAVAIKILQQTDPYLVDKFVQEGNKIGPLLRNHPNIVYVYEFGQSSDHRLFIVMEYVDAPALRKVLGRALSEAEIVNVMGQVCGALGYAHQNQVVHRDIKPENILLSADGVVKVLDFGIAKLTSAATVTRDKIIGTPEYISPEQARGEPVRPASDVYSMGIVLYEMLTGSVPFPRPRGEDPFRAAMEVIRQHLQERPEPIRKRRANGRVSAQLEKVTMKALEKELKKRYESATEMGQALGYQEVAVSLPTPGTSLPKASLLVVQGPRQGTRFPLPDGVLTLGRGELGSNNLSISRQHAQIRQRGGTYWLEDTSKNGTLVDGQRVYGEVPLKPGAEIIVGDNVLRLEQS